MSESPRRDRAQYEERYDTLTVELCRVRERIVYDTLGEPPALGPDGEADSGSGYFQYSLLYFELVESLAGERCQKRDATIEGWMAEDEARDQRLEDAEPATTPYCPSCGEDMQLISKNYFHRERGRTRADAEDILFMFECKPCKRRSASWQDGTKWEPRPTRCEQCHARVDETDRLRGKVITITYTCDSCGHAHKSTLKLGGEDKAMPDPYFKLDRRRFCFDHATGKKFLERQAHIRHLREMLELGRRQAGGETETIDPVADAVRQIQLLTVAQVADLLAKAVSKAGYTEFKLGEPQIGREVAVPFSCLDNQPEREAYSSRTKLKRLITASLSDTNWRLMSEGVGYRVGYLSGRLRAYESDVELRQLAAAKQVKRSRTKANVGVPAPEPPARTPDAPSTPKRARRGKERTIRVRGILHQNLHMLIPPRDATTPVRPRTKTE